MTVHSDGLATTPERVQGPARPAGHTPALPAGALRRTSTIDISRPEGPDGPQLVDARARDVIGPASPTTRPWVLGTATLRAVLDPDTTLRSLTLSGTGMPELGVDLAGAASTLVGARVVSGFRRLAVSALPALPPSGLPLWTLLDDLPPAMLVSNYARLRDGFQPPWVRAGSAPKADICAGWRREGTLVQGSLRRGRQLVTLGPPAPVLEQPEQPGAWHPVDPLPPIGARRRRRLDVLPGPVLRVDAMFRDTYAEPEGPPRETVVHEYGVVATVDPDSLVVLDAAADPHVLPYVECPLAAASAGRVAGRRLGRLRDEIRAEFVGTTTCTHLNDLLRNLADVTGLLAAGARETTP